jgi:hypothetical protein
MVFAAWKRVVCRQSGGFPARPFLERRAVRRQVAPALEELETRLLPSTYTVTDLGDAGAGSGLEGNLRYVINAANSNDEASNQIVFQDGLSGTIPLTQGKLVVTKALEIDGPGADLLTVSGNNQSGVFDIEAPAGQTVTLSDLTIADGTGSGSLNGRTVGGGLFNEADTVILRRVSVSGNTVPSRGIGGGIYNDVHGSMVLNDSTVSDNRVSRDSFTGAIENLGTLTLNRTTVSGNSAPGLGGTLVGTSIENAGGKLTIDHSLITGNTGGIASGGSGSQIIVSASTITNNTGYAGAGISNSVGKATITDSTIANNSTQYVGGGLYNQVGQMIVSGSTIAGNTALYGGGIEVASGSFRMINCTISGNTAQNEGGGLWAGYIHSGVLELTSVTITLNTSLNPSSGYGGGGGVYLESVQAFRIRNSIVAGNSTAVGGPDVDGDVVSLGHNLIGQTDDSTGWVASDLTGTSANPLDPGLGPLQDNGGPTMTHALLAGSPAIGAGDPALAGSMDQRGSVRVSSQPLDIGAFQTEPADHFVILAPSLVGPGEPFTITVIALDQWGNVASTYAGTVQFSSTDASAQLADTYTFVPDDAGAHTFTVVMQTPGAQDLTVSDADPLSNARGSVTMQVTDSECPR